MIEITRPMLAATLEDLSDLNYPVLASPKIDGIRVLHVLGRGIVTRKFKPVPNKHIRERLSILAPYGADGEIVTFNKDGTQKTFNQIQSDVMSFEGTPYFVYYIFDNFMDPEMEFWRRLLNAEQTLWKPETITNRQFQYLMHVMLYDEKALKIYNQDCLEKGYEGVMIRSPDSPYKQGRSTLKQGWLLKLKQFADAEGIVVGFEELMYNENEQTQDELGLAERSSHLANLVPGDTLGALTVMTSWGEMRLGTGFDFATRDLIWNAKEAYLGKTVTFKYQPHGMQDLPRFPVFLGFREDVDIKNVGKLIEVKD